MTPGSHPAQLNPASAIPWGTPGPDALAGTLATRRFGIQELIWNRHIWTSERADEDWRDYNVPAGGSPHTDHIHVGLTRRAGNRNTSAWTGFDACRPGQAGCPPA
jgi:hypothetical protein